MLESRVVTAFPLNDQEILCRHLHKVAADWVADYTRERAEADAMTDALLPSRVLRPRAVRARRGACRPSASASRSAWPSSMDEMQAFYDAFFPRAEEAIAYCDQFPLDDMPDDAERLLQLLYSLVMVSFPVEAWRQPHVPDSGAAYLDLADRAAPVSDDAIVLRADRWVDVDAGEVRSPAVDRRRGRAHRRGRTRPSVPSGATEIDLGDVTLLPGLMDMELNMLLGGPQRREPAQRRPGRPRVPHVARRR